MITGRHFGSTGSKFKDLFDMEKWSGKVGSGSESSGSRILVKLSWSYRRERTVLYRSCDYLGVAGERTPNGFVVPRTRKGWASIVVSTKKDCFWRTCGDELVYAQRILHVRVARLGGVV